MIFNLREGLTFHDTSRDYAFAQGRRHVKSGLVLPHRTANRKLPMDLENSSTVCIPDANSQNIAMFA